MTDRVRAVRRRVVLAGALAVLAVDRAARAQPVVAAPAPPEARGTITPQARDAIELLRRARAWLCPRCSDDIERSGVNHPSLRSINGSGWIERASNVIEATPGLPGAVPALRLLSYGTEVLEFYGEEEATWAIDAAIVALQAEGRVAAGAPPDPRALIGQLRLVRRFICPRCVSPQSEDARRKRARATEELAVAREMLAAAPRLRHAEQVAARLGVAQQALAASDDRQADAALAWAIERLRPLPRAAR
ncbi:hypothetical protein [Roseomonas sp. CECT 9278]|uniref:hypothetical protein n=1 Tax=Roseomonas sp. CECT 9278 TaxID=2845823 RepID=UPI001E5B4D5D|nr:hypothetical protein [Roseomonas sp. CECT 9278]CAH0271840.1 hypothetical protein ROS9278_03686 [Roseomonas sp. CECT 9278]